MNPELNKILILSLISSIFNLWPLWLAIALVIMYRVGKFIWLRRRYQSAGLAEIDAMSGEDFEQFLVNLFAKLGYRVEHIGRLGDYGGDLILEKDGVKTLVQAKRQKTWVKESAVQQAIAAKEHYRCDRAMVVTNRFYFRHAWYLGKSTGTDLWTRNDLVKAILQARSLS